MHVRPMMKSGGSYQLLLQVDGPDDGVVSHSEDEEEEEAQLRVAHLPHTAVQGEGVFPVRQPVHQDVIVPATTSHDGVRPRAESHSLG